MTETKLRSNFASTVKLQRESIGWSQQELARKCKVHPTYICQIEKGNRLPNLLNALKLAQALGLAVDDLCSG